MEGVSEPGQAQQRGGEWLVLVAAVLWGTTGTAQAFAPPGATPFAIGALRLVVGSMALLTIAVWRGEFKQGTPWSKSPLLLAAGCMAAYQLCFFAAVLRSGVALGTLVATAAAYTLFARGLQRVPAATALSLSLVEPLTAALLGISLLGEQLTPLRGLGMGLLFGGLVLLTWRHHPR
jgi:DME family drug/metabolite transporter